MRRVSDLLVELRVIQHLFLVRTHSSIDDIWSSVFPRASAADCDLRYMGRRLAEDATTPETTPVIADYFSAGQPSVRYIAFLFFFNFYPNLLLIRHIKLKWLIWTIRLRWGLLIDEFLAFGDNFLRANQFFEFCEGARVLERVIQKFTVSACHSIFISFILLLIIFYPISSLFAIND